MSGERTRPRPPQDGFAVANVLATPKAFASRGRYLAGVNRAFSASFQETIEFLGRCS